MQVSKAYIGNHMLTSSPPWGLGSITGMLTTATALCMLCCICHAMLCCIVMCCAVSPLAKRCCTMHPCTMLLCLCCPGKGVMTVVTPGWRCWQCCAGLCCVVLCLAALYGARNTALCCRQSSPWQELRSGYAPDSTGTLTSHNTSSGSHLPCSSSIVTPKCC